MINKNVLNLFKILKKNNIYNLVSSHSTVSRQCLDESTRLKNYDLYIPFYIIKYVIIICAIGVHYTVEKYSVA